MLAAPGGDLNAEARWLIVLVGIVYLYVAWDQWRKGSVGGAIIYTGYAFSNAGLFMLAK